jgi:hypothetical protein
MDLAERIALYDASQDVANRLLGLLIAQTRAERTSGNEPAAAAYFERVKTVTLDRDQLDSRDESVIRAAIERWAGQITALRAA